MEIGFAGDRPVRFRPFLFSPRGPTLLRTLLITCLTFYGVAPLTEGAPRAEAGFLDLSHWPPQERGPLALAGEWEFYWQQFLEPADFLSSPPPQPTGFLTVPGAWNGYTVAGEVLPGDGYATYRLRIRVPSDWVSARPGNAALGLHMPWVLTAYRLWLNGELMAANGVVGTDAHGTTPQFLPQTVFFNTGSEWLELIVQVSNFSHRNGGLWNSPLLGTQKQIQHRERVRLTIDMALVGALAFIGTYHLAVARLLGPQPRSLHLGLLALVVAARTLVTSEHLLSRLVDGLPWELSIRLEYLTGFAYLPLALGFLSAAFPQETAASAVAVARFIGFAGMAATVIFPVRLVSRWIPFHMVVAALFSLYVIGVFVAAAKRKRDGARVLLAGGLIHSFSALHDLLHYNLLGLDMDLLPLGLFLFLVCQALSLLEQFLKVFQREVALSTENARLLDMVRQQLEAAKESRRLLAQVDENLRRTIAERLHGRVQGRLLHTWHKLHLAKKALPENYRESEKLIEEARAAIDEVREVDIRHLSHLLHPSIVQLGLVPALESLSREYRDAVHIALEADPRVTALDQIGDNRIPEPIRLVAYRVVEEALSNVLAHARATRVTISLSLEDDTHLRLAISDDGQGFDPHLTQHHLGLRTIEARVASVDGEWQLRSGKGQGTHITVKLPLTPRGL